MLSGFAQNTATTEHLESGLQAKFFSSFAVFVFAMLTSMLDSWALCISQTFAKKCDLHLYFWSEQNSLHI